MNQNTGSLGKRNKYFRHATSKDLATFILVNRHILHKYANEVLWVPGSSVLMSSILMKGASAMGLRKIASGRPKLVIHVLHPLTGVAVVFANRWKGWREVHQRCGEGDGAVWHSYYYDAELNSTDFLEVIFDSSKFAYG